MLNNHSNDIRQKLKLEKIQLVNSEREQIE